MLRRQLWSRSRPIAVVESLSPKVKEAGCVSDRLHDVGELFFKLGHPILNLPLFQVAVAFANHTVGPIPPRLRIPTTNMRGCGKDAAVQAPVAVPPPHMECV
jgi:hypothetical protein